MVGDRLTFTDGRGATRAVDLAAVGVDGCWAESTRTCYFTSDVRVRAQRAGVDTGAEASVSGISPVDAVMPLARGDLLILTRELTPGRRLTAIASVACSIRPQSGVLRRRCSRTLARANGCGSTMAGLEASSNERSRIASTFGSRIRCLGVFKSSGCVFDVLEWSG
jgi:hypothetical protein